MAIGPKCKECGKEMTPKQMLGFNFALQFIIDVVTSGGVKALTDQEFGCKNKVKNPKHKEWLDLKKDYDKKMQERQKVIDRNNKMPIGLLKKKVPPPPPPIPPEPPKQIPCKNHWKSKAVGKFNESLVKKKKQEFYYADGSKVQKFL